MTVLKHDSVIRKLIQPTPPPPPPPPPLPPQAPQVIYVKNVQAG